MKVVFGCPGCQTSQSARISPETGKIACARCQWQRPISASEVAGGTPHRCLVCGCQDLWRQKGFPPRVGVAVVIAKVADHARSRSVRANTWGALALLACLLLVRWWRAESLPGEALWSAAVSSPVTVWFGAGVGALSDEPAHDCGW